MAIIQAGIFKRTLKPRDIKLAVGLLGLVAAAVFIYSFINFVNPFDRMASKLGPVGTPTPIFGIYGSGTVGPMQKPMGVTVNNQKVFVTDATGRRVAVFDYNGNPLYSFGKPGTDKGQFQFPYGITADNAGQIYVADMDAGKISVLTQSGNFIKYFADQKGLIVKPAGLYFYDGDIFVTDLAQNKVLEFDATGKKILEFGTRGNGAGQFNSPNDVTVTSDAIYVSDSGNDRVEKFSKQGKFIAMTYGKTGPDKSSSAFVNTRGIGVDSKGTLYVVSNLTNNMFGFTKDGKLAFPPVGQLGIEDNEFKTPNGLYIDGQDRIYVVDTLNQRVMVYHN